MSEKPESVESIKPVLVLVAVLAVACVVSLVTLGLAVHKVRLQAEALVADFEKCQCAAPAPTPAPCCKADECRQELAKVDARFGGVWDELVEVQEQLAKLKPCGCGPVKECCCDLSEVCKCDPSKPCACSDKPACECKPQQTIKLPAHRVPKRCK